MLQVLHARQQRIVIARRLRPAGATPRDTRRAAPRLSPIPETTASNTVDSAVERRLLRHVADADARLHPDLAVVEPPARAGRQRRQQGGLAGAVAADQRDALARIEQKIGVIEQRHVAVGEAGIGEFEVGHFPARRRERQ